MANEISIYVSLHSTLSGKTETEATTKYPVKFEGQEHLPTYFFDYATQFINITIQKQM